MMAGRTSCPTREREDRPACDFGGWRRAPRARTRIARVEVDFRSSFFLKDFPQRSQGTATMFSPSPSGRSNLTLKRQAQQGRASPAYRSSRPSTPVGGRDGVGATTRGTATPSERRGPRFSSASTSGRPLPVQKGPLIGRQQSQDLIADEDAGEITLGRVEDGQLMSPGVGTVFRHDDFSAVSVLSQLPTEVRKALNKCDPYSDAATGALDVVTGHGLLVTSSRLFVWSFETQQSSYTTCYTFSTVDSGPASSRSSPSIQALPHAKLVPRSVSREPGLLLVGADGRIRFWDSIAASLTGEDRCQHLSVLLGGGEAVVSFLRADASTYVIGTSHSRLFRISVLSTGGRLQAQVSAFQQPRGIFGRLFGGASGGTPALSYSVTEESFVLAASPPMTGQGWRDIYTLRRGTLQRWRLIDGGGEKILGEQDIIKLIATKHASDLQRDQATSDTVDNANIAVLDVSCFNDGELAVLYAFAEQPNAPLSYGLATLQPSPDHAAFALSSNILLRYRSLRDPRPYSSPRLLLPNGGPAVFVVFADALVLTLRSPSGDLEAAKEPFEEVISLKVDVRNRFIGFGCEGADVAAADDTVAAISLLSAQSGSLLVECSIRDAQNFVETASMPSERQSVLTNRLQVKLEQAVFFDSSAVNPLSFAVSQSQASSGDLALAAEALSSAIVTSSSAYVQQSIDVKAHLNDRLLHLKDLIQVLYQNDLLGRLTTETRCQLRADAELLSAGAELWRYHNQASEGHDTGGQGLLADAIEDTMAGLGLGYGQDTVRLFFRKHLKEIVSVFENLQTRLKHLDKDRDAVGERSRVVAQMNRIVLSAYHGAHRYRSSAFATEHYGLASDEDGLSDTRCEAWTLRTSSLQYLEQLYSVTESLVRERKRELGAAVDLASANISNPGARDTASTEQSLQQELKSQMCELARFALATFHDRVDYLSHKGSASEKERNACLGQYRAAKPRMVYPLVDIGRPDRAFGLAERHRDFRTLTELCLNPATGDPQPQIQHYLRRYKQDFAFELYQYWLDNGRTAEMLEHGASAPEWSDLLERFLHDATSDAYPRVSWLHDISRDNFQAASATLLIEASRETASLSSKNAMLSLGKLNYLAQFDEDALASHDEQRRIELIDDQLDLVSVHHKLIETFQAMIANASVAERRAAASAGRQGPAEIVGQRLLSSLHEEGQEAFVQHYLRLTGRLLEGNVLTSEGLIDLLSMRDDADADHDQTRAAADDLGTALEVALRAREAEGLQRSRLSAITASIWRRALLRDDWQGSISQTRGASDGDIVRRLKNTAWYRLALAARSAQLGSGDDGDGGEVPADIACLLGRPDIEGLLHAIAQTPTQEVCKARFQEERRRQRRADAGQDGLAGMADDDRELASGAGADIDHQAQLFHDDLSHEVARVRAILGGDYQEEELQQSATSGDNSTLDWIREAYRLAREEGDGGGDGSVDDAGMDSRME
ncbi:unnamed protein product [Parajaminaea phylloscopi]